jgi:hypothetical protein
VAQAEATRHTEPVNTYLSAARAILKDHPSGLHYEELTRRALEQGLITTSGKTPEASMNAQLSTTIKRHGSAAPFVRLKPGVFALNLAVDENPPTATPAKADAKKTPRSPKDDEAIESAFTGKGGEHAVAAELLFRGFNASIMSVDTGMDIVATKNSKLFNIQVKTSNLNQFATYVFDIRVSSFERHNSGTSFYIFVLRDDTRGDYLVVPFFELEKKIHEGAIRTVNEGTRYRVNVRVRNGRVALGTKEHDVTYYLNNWNVIK